MQITFDLGQEAEQKLQAIMQFMQDGKARLLAIIGSVLVSEINEGFVSAKDPWGNSWAALKVRKGQPLRDTGRLKSSINYQVQGDQVEVGTNVAYAATHQFGETITPQQAKMLRFFNGSIPIFAKKVVIPARPFMPLTPENQVDLPDSWQRSVVRNIQQFFESNL